MSPNFTKIHVFQKIGIKKVCARFCLACFDKYHPRAHFVEHFSSNSNKFRACFVRSCSKFTKILFFGQFGPTLPHPLIFTPAIWEPKTWRRPKNQIKLPECIRFCAESNSNAAEICLQVIWFGLRTKRAQSQVFLAKKRKKLGFSLKWPA